MNILDFCRKNGIQLELVLYYHSWDANLPGASFKEYTKHHYCKEGINQHGDTALEALNLLTKRVRGKVILFYKHQISPMNCVHAFPDDLENVTPKAFFCTYAQLQQLKRNKSDAT